MLRWTVVVWCAVRGRVVVVVVYQNSLQIFLACWLRSSAAALGLDAPLSRDDDILLHVASFEGSTVGNSRQEDEEEMDDADDHESLCRWTTVRGWNRSFAGAGTAVRPLVEADSAV